MMVQVGVQNAAVAPVAGCKEERSLEALVMSSVGEIPVNLPVVGSIEPSQSATAGKKTGGNNNHLEEFSNARSKLAFFKQQKSARSIGENEINLDGTNQSGKSRRRKVNSHAERVRKNMEEIYGSEGASESEGNDLDYRDTSRNGSEADSSKKKSMNKSSSLSNFIAPRNRRGRRGSKSTMSYGTSSTTTTKKQSNSSNPNNLSVTDFVQNSTWAENVRKKSESSSRKVRRNRLNSFQKQQSNYMWYFEGNNEELMKKMMSRPNGNGERRSQFVKSHSSGDINSMMNSGNKNKLRRNKRQSTGGSVDMSMMKSPSISQFSPPKTPTSASSSMTRSTAAPSSPSESQVVTPYNVLHDPKHKISARSYSDLVMLAAGSNKSPMSSLTKYLGQELLGPNSGEKNRILDRTVNSEGAGIRRKSSPKFKQLSSVLPNVPFSEGTTNIESRENRGDSEGENTKAALAVQAFGKSVAKSMKKQAKNTKRKIGKQISKMAPPQTTSKSKLNTHFLLDDDDEMDTSPLVDARPLRRDQESDFVALKPPSGHCPRRESGFHEEYGPNSRKKMGLKIKSKLRKKMSKSNLRRKDDDDDFESLVEKKIVKASSEGDLFCKRRSGNTSGSVIDDYPKKNYQFFNDEEEDSTIATDLTGNMNQVGNENGRLTNLSGHQSWSKCDDMKISTSSFDVSIMSDDKEGSHTNSISRDITFVSDGYSTLRTAIRSDQQDNSVSRDITLVSDGYSTLRTAIRSDQQDNSVSRDITLVSDGYSTLRTAIRSDQQDNSVSRDITLVSDGYSTLRTAIRSEQQDTLETVSDHSSQESPSTEPTTTTPLEPIDCMKVDVCDDESSISTFDSSIPTSAKSSTGTRSKNVIEKDSAHQNQNDENQIDQNYSPEPSNTEFEESQDLSPNEEETNVKEANEATDTSYLISTGKTKTAYNTSTLALAPEMDEEASKEEDDGNDIPINDIAEVSSQNEKRRKLKAPKVDLSSELFDLLKKENDRKNRKKKKGKEETTHRIDRHKRELRKMRQKQVAIDMTDMDINVDTDDPDTSTVSELTTTKRVMHVNVDQNSLSAMSEVTTTKRLMNVRVDHDPLAVSEVTTTQRLMEPVQKLILSRESAKPHRSRSKSGSRSGDVNSSDEVKTKKSKSRRKEKLKKSKRRSENDLPKAVSMTALM